MMKKHRFGREYPPEQHTFDFQKELTQPLTGTNSLVPAVSLRLDRNKLGGSFLLRGLDLGEGYLVPKINLNEDDISFEGLFTRSAAQFFSWYLTGGAAYEAKRVEDESGDWVVTNESHWRFVAELGVKFRVRLSGKKRIFSLGYQFAGMRVGLRNSGWPEFDDIRLVIEIGAGVW
jgi:hypothetical protein